MKERINFNDLYYGICNMDDNTGKMVSYNIFDIYRVKRSVADWVLMSDERKSEIEDPIRYCFSDVWSRCEYEWIVTPWPPKETQGEKVDVYDMYIEPNRALLMDMLDNVSLKSAREYAATAERVDEPMEKQHMDILEMAEVLTDPAPIPVVEQLKEVGTEHLDILEEEKPKPKKKTRYGSASATPGAESSTNGWCLLAKGEENENN